MLPSALLLLCLAAVNAEAQDTTNVVSITGSYSTLSTVPTSDFTGSEFTYLTSTGQSTVSTSSSSSSNATATDSSGSGQVTRTSTSQSVTAIVGGVGATSASNGTASGGATSTSSAATPVNTVPCNNYPEFCNRKYSNITEVCAHNSAFSVKNNAASNQQLSITQQLNDGIRMLQGETHWVNNTVFSCHSSCDLLNAGTWQSELETIVSWLEKNPYDVVTFLIVNSNFAEGTTVTNYTSAIEASGIRPYLYEPEYVPQHREQWPTLGEMILSGKRVVLFMDYNANQTEVPYVLDEFTHMFETPFSPTNQSFPCTLNRPPGLSVAHAEENYMYLANHNLNLAIDIGAITGDSSSGSLLIPSTSNINITNGEEDQYGRLGAMNTNCTDISPPPAKRRVTATTTNTAVSNFFKPASQKEPEKVTFQVLHESLLVGRYQDAGTATRPKPLKVAAFDFDDTIITTKSGNKFGRGADDWKWWHAAVPGRLKELHEDGYAIVVMSNQAAVSLRSDAKTPKDGMRSLSNIKGKITAVLNALSLPVSVYAATEHDIYRKPRTGMWEQMLKDYGLTDAGDIDHERCVFVGDAAGREGDKAAGVKKDHSCSDRDFAANNRIPFHAPEEYFLGEATKPFKRNFDPAAYVEVEVTSQTDSTPIVFTKKHDVEIVLFCGSPGAGKSTFHWHHMQPLGYERVNQDILKSRDKCMKAATQIIDEGTPVVVGKHTDE
ncbi:hypothetical protein LTR85_006924 [Meristemomyces frigidus]|nr:hypothetical protein LTR85_006924 [Meristemomyces frigidus]